MNKKIYKLKRKEELSKWSEYWLVDYSDYFMVNNFYGKGKEITFYRKESVHRTAGPAYVNEFAKIGPHIMRRKVWYIKSRMIQSISDCNDV